MKNPQQLSLGVALNDDATFDNFYLPEGSANQQIIDMLARFCERQTVASNVALNITSNADSQAESFVFLWGDSGAGVSHLLNAAAHRIESEGLNIQYLPLRELLNVDPGQLFDGLERADLVALDDLHLIAGDSVWEQAMFHLFNRLRDNGKRLLTGANCGPHQLPLILPDLHSRLAWGVTFKVVSLSDEQMIPALRMRARNRGFELQEEVAQFILHRAPRDMVRLFGCLNQLDKASLVEQRKVTIPFVKQVLDL